MLTVVEKTKIINIISYSNYDFYRLTENFRVVYKKSVTI